MRIHEELKTKSRKFLSLTSLRPDEFMGLLPAFGRAYQRKYPGSKTIAGKVCKRQASLVTKDCWTTWSRNYWSYWSYQNDHLLNRHRLNCIIIESAIA